MRGGRRAYGREGRSGLWRAMAGGGGGGNSPFRQRDTAHVVTNALKSTQIEGICDAVESAFDPSGPPCPSGADSSMSSAGELRTMSSLRTKVSVRKLSAQRYGTVHESPKLNLANHIFSGN